MTGERGRTRIDPLVAGVSDGVSYGYQALERVLQGLAESLQVQARAGAPRRASPAPQPGEALVPTGPRPAGVLGLVDELAQVFAELLGRGGELAQDVARSIA